jgi:hypothetical protein
VIYVKWGRAQKIAMGIPATTMEDVLGAAMARWGPEGDEWTLDWGDGEFVASDNEMRATVEFKKLAGVHMQNRCGLRVED